MASKKVLGRGLGAFFPDYDEHSSDEEHADKPRNENRYLDPQQRVNVVLEVPVENIRPNPHQPRRTFDEERLQELASSIKEHGLIQPITVRYIGEKRFELISGERRLRASKLAGVEKVAAYVREVDDEQIVSFALIENIQREDLNPMEVAVGYQRLMEEVGYTQNQVAEKVGKNRSTVANMLRLLKLPAYVQAALRDDILSMGHARALLPVEEEKDQKKIFDAIIEKGYSVRATEEAVRSLSLDTRSASKAPSGAGKKPSAHAPLFKEISTRLRRTLSTKVDIKSKKKGGEIRIAFYSNDELERLLELFESIS